MNTNEALQYIRQENPALVHALQVLTNTTMEPQQRAALNTLLTEVIAIKGDCVDKRLAAQTLIGWRTCTVSDDTRSETVHSQFLRQPPDVMIRALCRIAECTHHYAGDPAFLDALEARNNG